MKFKLDENLGNDVAKQLRRAGHNVSTVPSQKLCSKPDKTVIETCRKEKRCLITLDLEFGNPFLFKPSLYSGIAVLRLPKKPSPKICRIASIPSSMKLSIPIFPANYGLSSGDAFAFIRMKKQ